MHFSLHRKVRDAVHKRIAVLTAWSMGVAGTGVWPDEGFEGVPFPGGSERYKCRGTRLAVYFT